MKMQRLSFLMVQVLVVLALLFSGPSFLHAEVLVSGASYDQLSPHIAFNEIDNQYLTVWEDRRWGFGAARDLYGQRSMLAENF